MCNEHVHLCRLGAGVDMRMCCCLSREDLNAPKSHEFLPLRLCYSTFPEKLHDCLRPQVPNFAVGLTQWSHLSKPTVRISRSRKIEGRPKEDRGRSRKIEEDGGSANRSRKIEEDRGKIEERSRKDRRKDRRIIEEWSRNDQGRSRKDRGSYVFFSEPFLGNFCDVGVRNFFGRWSVQMDCVLGPGVPPPAVKFTSPKMRNRAMRDFGAHKGGRQGAFTWSYMCTYGEAAVLEQRSFGGALLWAVWIVELKRRCDMREQRDRPQSCGKHRSLPEIYEILPFLSTEKDFRAENCPKPVLLWAPTVTPLQRVATLQNPCMTRAHEGRSSLSILKSRELVSAFLLTRSTPLQPLPTTQLPHSQENVPKPTTPPPPLSHRARQWTLIGKNTG